MEGSYPIKYLAQNAILLIILYMASSISYITALEKTNVEFIRSSCSLTTYPTLCFNSLSTRAGAIQTSPKLLAQTALSVTLETTRTTSSAMVKLSQVHGMTPREVAAMKDCIEMLSDSVYELKRSLEEMSDKDPPLKVYSRRKDRVTAEKGGQLCSIFGNWLNPLDQITG